ncbi:2-oxo acid dehydrogenase subunit E2 [Trebonia sp.]|uniref:2-oxo acid dehydrogenase subunit E2 n=1 Tax=Trebonia sp. TaxID=2767075 RepID=UPI00260D1FED|nr:2-oxo acid dehydrogenase subunit E2 [Trebonia sp.]
MSKTPCQEVPWPRIRELVTDTLTAGHRAHLAHGLVEVDVSRALAGIERYKSRLPDGVSFTAYIVYCLGQAVGAHTIMHAYRKGRGKLVIFDDVDVSALLEKRKPDGSLVPVPYIVRGANGKSLAQINHELRQAVNSDMRDDQGVRRRRRIMRLPRRARALLWWWMFRDPARLKQQWGTVAVSNVGSFMLPRAFWGMASSFLTCTLTIGGRYERVAWVDGRAEPRVTQSVTVTIDHDVVDGAPAARFAQTLIGLLEDGAGLDDAFAAEAARLSGLDHATA